MKDIRRFMAHWRQFFTIRKGLGHMDRISPAGDLGFKKVLASEGNKDILAGFIRDFYGFDVDESDLVLEHPYSIAAYREYVEGREVSVLRHTGKDVAASFNPLIDVTALLKRADFISEMQIKKARYFAERFLYYPFERFCQNYNKAGFMETGTDGKPNRYSSLRPVYALNIIAEPHFTDDGDALRVFEMYDPRRHKRYPKRLVEIGFFELSKHNVETDNQKQWQDYFRTGIASPNAPDYIHKASQVIDFVNLTEEERAMANVLEKAQALYDAEICDSYFDGMDAGIEKGKAEGLAEGKAEGLAKGKAEGLAEGLAEGMVKEKSAIAKNLLQFHMALDDVAKMTGLSIQALEALREEIR